MTDLATVMTESGIVAEEEMSELRRWRLPGVPAEAVPPAQPLSPVETEQAFRALCNGIETVLQSRDLVLVRVTDPDLLPQYMGTRARGELHVQMGAELGIFDVVFGRAPTGAYVFPWSSEALQEAFESGDVVLHIPVEGAEPVIVHFSAASVYFYGDVRTFIVCTPRPGDA